MRCKIKNIYRHHKPLKALAIVICLAGAFLLLPYLMGVIAEHNLARIINTMAAIIPLETQITNYERHWLYSDVTLVTTLKPYHLTQLQNNKLGTKLEELLQKYPLTKLNINAHILHGPIIFMPFSTEIKLAQAIISADVNLWDKKNALSERLKNVAPTANMQIFIRLNGNSILQINSPSFTYQSKRTPSKIDWLGLNANLYFSNHLSKIKGTVNLNGINVNSQAFAIKLKNLQTSYNISKINNNLWIGDKSITIEYFALKDKKENNAAIDHLNVSSYSKENHGMIYGKTNVYLKNLVINNDKYSDILIDWHAERLNATALADLQNMVRSMKDIGDENFFKNKINQTIDLLVRLLRDNADINLTKLSLTTPWGKMATTAHTKFDDHREITENLASLINKMQLDLTAQIDRKLLLHGFQIFFATHDSVNETKLTPLQQAQLIIQQLEKTGKIIAKENYYTISLTYKEHQLTINPEKDSKPL
jgi:hypothetical protein